MQKYDIHSIRRAAYKITTCSNHSFPIAPDLLQRHFTVPAPNTVSVGDITYIGTDEWWLYLAILNDLFTKKIVGYAFSNHIDSHWTWAAMRMAIQRQKPAAGLIFHSDRGSQYASYPYRNLLLQHRVRQSMSQRDNPYNNAIAENFFNCLKCEFVHFQHFHTRLTAEAAISRYIEAY